MTSVKTAPMRYARNEVLEEVKDDNALIVGALLKDREARWRRELGSSRVLP